MITTGVAFVLLDLLVAGVIVFFLKRKPERESTIRQSRF